MRREEYISDSVVVRRAKEAVRIELEKKKALDIPAVVYDSQTQMIYHRNSDGTDVEVGARLRKGRYSEQVGKKA